MRKLLAILFNIHHPKDIATMDDDFKFYHKLMREQHDKHRHLYYDLKSFKDVCSRWGVRTPEELDNRLCDMHNQVDAYYKELHNADR